MCDASRAQKINDIVSRLALRPPLTMIKLRIAHTLVSIYHLSSLHLTSLHKVYEIINNNSRVPSKRMIVYFNYLLLIFLSPQLFILWLKTERQNIFLKYSLLNYNQKIIKAYSFFQYLNGYSAIFYLCRHILMGEKLVIIFMSQSLLFSSNSCEIILFLL